MFMYFVGLESFPQMGKVIFNPNFGEFINIQSIIANI